LFEKEGKQVNGKVNNTSKQYVLLRSWRCHFYCSAKLLPTWKLIAIFPRIERNCLHYIYRVACSYRCDL